MRCTLHLACLLGGVSGIDITLTRRLLELAGRGFGALVAAASARSHRYFNLLIAAARGLRPKLGSATPPSSSRPRKLAGGPLQDIPVVDIATMHRLWSWVADPVREGLVALLDSKFAGVVQIATTPCLAGRARWVCSGCCERLASVCGPSTTSGGKRETVRSSPRQMPVTCVAAPSPVTVGARAHNRAYLAHEITQTTAWRPCFHADVVAALTGANRLVASAQLIENFTTLMLATRPP